MIMNLMNVLLRGPVLRTPGSTFSHDDDDDNDDDVFLACYHSISSRNTQLQTVERYSIERVSKPCCIAIWLLTVCL